ncbi:lipopolysaccharide biosynthesis protein [Persicobacter diffluens]|uniref:Capsular polysaccharide biosynthesis protein n=1 Tax=Persicobacter diffluens TaxID=981 RepID=A0AAN4VX56_9BACT|nr:capsular polysaccharide biosynthesis protein [Persicobacter diffluens]
MGVVIKQGVRASLITYFGVIFGALNFLYIMPKILEPDQIGMIRLLQDLAILLASFVQFSLPTVLDRFIPVFRKEGVSSIRFALIYPLPFAGIFLFIFAMNPDFWSALLIPDNPEMQPYFLLVPLLMVILIGQLMMESFYRANLKIAFPNFIKEVFVRMTQTLLVVGLALKLFGFETIMLGIVVAYGLGAILLFAYAHFKGWLDWRGSVFPQKEKQKEIAHYAWFVLLSSAGALVASKVDTLMISSMVGLDALGIYVIAFFIGSVIEIPRRAISQIAIPLISKAFKEGEIEAIRKLYRQTAGVLIVVGSWLFLGIWCNLDFVYDVMPNAEIYRTGAMVMFWIGMSKVVDMVFGLNSEIILQSDQYRKLTYFTASLAVLLVLTNLWLIPIYGISGAAFATFLSMMIFNLLKLILILRVWGIQPFGMGHLYFIPFIVLPYIIIQSLPEFNMWGEFLVRGIIITLSVYFGAVISGVSEDLQQLNKRILTSFSN